MAAAKPPEKYALAIPDGYGAFIDAADLREAETLARQSGWSNDDAQAFVDEQAGLRKGQAERFHAAVTADVELGGDQLAASQQLVRTVIDRFLPASESDGKQLRLDLIKHGFGSYPPLVRLLVRIGKLMAEDKPVSGGPAGGERKPTANVLYDKTAPTT